MSAKDDLNLSEATADVGYERHDVNIPYIVAFAVICLVAIVAGVCMVDGFFYLHEGTDDTGGQQGRTESITPVKSTRRGRIINLRYP